MKPQQKDLLAILREFGRAAARRPPGEGWHTLDELVAQEHKDDPTVTLAGMKYRIKRAKERGIRVETATGTAVDETGRPRRTCYYRLGNGKP